MNGAGGDQTGLFSDLAGLTARLMLYCLLSIVLMAMDHRGRYVDRVHRALNALAEPVYLLTDLPLRAMERGRDYFSNRADLLERLETLERERLVSEAQLNRIAELVSENNELRRILGAAERLETEYLPAELVRVELDPFAHRVLINRGDRDGVETGLPVIDAGGVLGQISAVFMHTAEVTLLSDPNHALPVRVLRTGLRTIAYGSGDTRVLKLPDVSMSADLKPGDLLLTSGLGGRFPAGLPVAEVIDITRQPGDAFATARAQPTGSLDRSHHVLLVMQAGSIPADTGAPEATDDPRPNESAGNTP